MAKQSQTAITALSANPIKQPPSLSPSASVLLSSQFPSNVYLRVPYPSSLKLCLSSPRVIGLGLGEGPLPRNIFSRNVSTSNETGNSHLHRRGERRRGRGGASCESRGTSRRRDFLDKSRNALASASVYQVNAFLIIRYVLSPSLSLPLSLSKEHISRSSVQRQTRGREKSSSVLRVVLLSYIILSSLS